LSGCVCEKAWMGADGLRNRLPESHTRERY
jgi:hypothetical protein